MNYRLLSCIIIIFIFISTSGTAKNVDPETARKAAINFYYEKANQYKSFSYKDISVASESAEIQNNRVLFYTFNLNIGGWVIVSADDRVIPVIAYSFEGTFKPEANNCCLNWWMDNVKKQISRVQVEDAGTLDEAASQWDYLTSRNEQNLEISKEKDVAPLLLAMWNQDKYYNMLCPIASGGPDGRAYVGCVATSMAVIMYYYRFPAKGNGTHGGINLGGTYYRWNEMLNELVNYNYGVAEIGYHAGKTVNMNYSSTGSGANTEDVPEAITFHFKYNTSCTYYAKSAFTTTAWNNKIITNLNAKHPIIYSGRNPSGGGGHAWVCDGYQGSNYFHMNWGWSGSGNGYYYLNNLSIGSYDFNGEQGGVFELYPPSSSYPTYCSGSTTVPYSYGTIEDGSGISNYQNNANCSWLISPTDAVSNITLYFNVLNTEAGNDVVKIYDGDNTSAPLLGTFSGSTLPPQVTSTGNKVLVTFTTNSSTNSSGWQLEYHSSYPVFCSGVTMVTDSNGTIVDGSGTSNYSYNQTCRWRIWPTNASSITIHFTEFNLATDDYVTLTNENGGQELAYLTGSTLPAQATYNTNKILVLFKTNGIYNSAGWAFNYTSTYSGVEENNPLGRVHIYPNPSKGKLSVDITPTGGNSDIALRLLSLDGRIVYNESLELTSGQQTHMIDVSALQSGIYFLNLSGAEGTLNTKVVIE